MAVESLDDELPISGNLSAEHSQNHPRPYYAKYQGHEFRHKTNSEVYAHHWGELKDLILFPGHLPELYLPTNESFNSTMPRAEHNTIISQCISLIQSRNSDKLWIVAYAVGYSIIAILLFNVTFDLWKAGHRWSTFLPIIIPVLVFFSPLLLLRDEKRRSQHKLHRNFAITSIILLIALACSIYLIVDFIEHVFSEVDSGDAGEKLENGLSAIKTWEGLQSLAGASVVLYLASLYREYKICSKKWVETLAPEWKLYNKEKIFKDWMRGYHSFIEERNIDHDFSIAVSRLIHIYSMKRHTFMTPNGENKDYLLEQWDGEDGNEKTKTFEAIDAFKTQLADLRIKLPDALLSLDQKERLEYMRFNSLSDLDFNSILARASKIRYENHLKSKLIENTYVVENSDIRKKWEEVILSTELNERFLAENNSNEREDIEAWFSNFLQASQNKPTAIFAQSGAGKTTTLLHICLASLQNKNAPCPLFVKAREISNMKIFNGDLSLEEIVQDRGFVSYWHAAKNKLLVIDGLDENPRGRHYAEHLHKSVTFYGAKLILSSRFNLKDNLRNFDQLELVDMSVTFKDKLIHSTSEIAEQRRMVSKNVFNRPDAQAASIFAIAELLKLSDIGGHEVNLSTYSIARWRFETLCKEKKRKLGGRIRYSQLAAAIGAYTIESYYELINAESMLGKDVAFDWGIIDEDGLLDDDHVGYCLSQYMRYVLNPDVEIKSRDEKIKQIIELWTDVFEEDDDKWFEEISRCIISADHDGLNIQRILEEIDETKNKNALIRRLIQIASEEWKSGDYFTKENIVKKFLGFEFDESCGRIVCFKEEHQPNWTRNEALDSSLWIKSVIDFHCETWENEDERWNGLEDTTWSYLTSIFIDETLTFELERLKQVSKFDIEQFPPNWPYDDMVLFIEKIQGNPTHKPLYYWNPEIEEKLLFGNTSRPQFIPLNKTKEKSEKVLMKLPLCMENIVVQILSEAHELEQAEAIKRLQKLHLYLNYVQLSQQNLNLFTIDYTEQLRTVFKTCINNCDNHFPNSDLPERIALLYGFFRNHNGTYKPQYFNYELRQKFTPASTPDSENKQFVINQYQYVTNVEIKSKNWSIWEPQVDRVNWKMMNYFDKLYSVVPMEYLNNCYRDVYVKRSEKNNKQTDWGMIDEPSNDQLFEILNDQREIERYANLMKFIPWLKLEGKYSNLEQTKSTAKAFGVDLENYYYGICVTKRGNEFGPDSEGRYYVHLISGTTGNDVYISKNTSASAFEYLDSLSKMAENSKIGSNEIYLKLKFRLKDVVSTGHSVLEPTEIIQVCRGCFDDLSRKVSSQIHSICLECKDLCAPPKPVLIEYLHDGENKERISEILNEVYSEEELSKMTKVKEHYHCLYIHFEGLVPLHARKSKLLELLNSESGILSYEGRDKEVYFNASYEWKPPVKLSEIELIELETQEDMELVE